MRLFLMEHQKLWRRGSVRICVLICLLYTVVIGSFLVYQWFSFGTSGDHTSSFGNHFDGYASIRARQDYADRWEGPVTDEKLQQMVRDYQEKHDAEQYEECEKMDWNKIEQWVSTLWPELEDTRNPNLMITYVDPDRLTGFYERREEKIKSFLELSDYSEAEKELFLEMDEKVRTPFAYRWTEGWSLLLGDSVCEVGIVMALFLAIALSPVFAGEWQSHMYPLVFTTRNGWRRTALAKVGAGFAFTAELFAMIMGGMVLMQVVFLGTEGWDLPIQCVKIIATAPMNVLQAEIYEWVYTLLAALGFAGIVMLFSCLCRSNFVALIGSLAVVFVPMAVVPYLPFEGQKLLDLIPLAGSAADIFRTNVYHVFGHLIWSPYLLITVPVMIGVLCIPVTVKRWEKKMKN